MIPSIQFHVSGNTMQDIRTQLSAILAELGGDEVTTVVHAAVDLMNHAPEAPMAKRGRGRPAKETKEEKPLANGKTDHNIFDEAPIETTAVSARKTYSKDEVNAAVQKVLGKVGGPGARAILQKFGAASTGQVKPEDYAALIAECEKA